MNANLASFFDSVCSMLGGVPSKYKANNHPAYKVVCPYCRKSGSVLGVGKDKQSYLLLCPNCEKGYSLHTLIQDHAPDDLKDAWWKFRSGWIDYKHLGYPIKHRSGELQGRSRTFRDKMRLAAEMSALWVADELSGRRDGELRVDHAELD